MTPYETDIAFLDKVQARKINDWLWFIEADEATYMITHCKPERPEQVAVWELNTNSNHNTADASEFCHEGEVQKAFDNLKKIALYMVEIGNLPDYP